MPVDISVTINPSEGLRCDKYDSQVKAALDEADKQKVYAIVRVEDREDELIRITQGVTQTKESSDFRGMGVTVFTDDGACAHGSTDVLTEDSIRKLIKGVAADANASSQFDVQRNKEIFSVPPTQAYEHIPVVEKPSLSELEAKLSEMHQTSLSDDMSVSTRFIDQNEHWRIARSDGTDVRFSMPMCRVMQIMTVRDGDNAQEVYFKVTGSDTSLIYEAAPVELYHHRTRKSVELVKQFLSAEPLPGGSYKCLLTSGFSGLLAHEAVGHPAESDLVRTSILGRDGKLKMGERVSPGNISFVDGPISGIWGDVRYSMNGVKREEVAFIKDGKIAGSLSDVFSAVNVDSPINGCGRSQTFQHVAIPRMSATRIVDSEPYQSDLHPDYATPEELSQLLQDMGELDQPVVVPVLGMGGSVGIEEGNFMFACAGIYMIKPDGEITIHNATSFGGTTLETIATRMRGVGELSSYDSGVCGKGGQHAPCSLGSHAYLLLDRTEAVTFGGQ